MPTTCCPALSSPFFFFSSRRRHTRFKCDWSSDVCSSDLIADGLRDIDWPARMQQLHHGPLIEMLPAGWELWLDGGHNPAAGGIIAAVARGRQDRPFDPLVRLLHTKNARGLPAPPGPHTRTPPPVPTPR